MTTCFGHRMTIIRSTTAIMYILCNERVFTCVPKSSVLILPLDTA